MPAIPPTPFTPGNDGGDRTPGQNTLQTSGNTSATDYIFWTEITQQLTGWWERKWMFQDDPSTPSSCGTVTGSYIVYHMEEAVANIQGENTFASGLTTLMDIDYFSDSASGGWGTSGMLYSVSSGYVRVSGVYGTAGTCYKQWDATGMYLAGDYDLNGTTGAGALDTSSFWNSTFNTKINYSDCVRACESWRPDIVII